jgi:drug/metabolite transporter (DMT)-like permease
MAWVALSGLILSTSFGQLLYKMYFSRKKLSILMAAVFFFLFAPLCSYVALQELTIGTVYMSTAATQIVVLAASGIVLKERLHPHHFVAALFIVAGIVLFNP